jgi:hypothetical protein
MASVAFGRRVGALSDFGQPEIEQLDSSFRDQDMRGLEVTVCDALAVCGIECITNLCGILERLMMGQGAAQRHAFDIFHYQIVRPDIMQGTDVGMVQGGDRVRFALEAIGELLVGKFDGDDAIQSRVASFVDFSRTASALGGDDLIWSQPGSWAKSIRPNDCTARDIGKEWITDYPEIIL